MLLFSALLRNYKEYDSNWYCQLNKILIFNIKEKTTLITCSFMLGPDYWMCLKIALSNHDKINRYHRRFFDTHPCSNICLLHLYRSSPLLVGYQYIYIQYTLYMYITQHRKISTNQKWRTTKWAGSEGDTQPKNLSITTVNCDDN